MPHELVDFAVSKTEALLAFLEELVRIESPTDNPAGIEQAQALLASRFRNAGAAVELILSRGNYLATCRAFARKSRG